MPLGCQRGQTASGKTSISSQWRWWSWPSKCRQNCVSLLVLQSHLQNQSKRKAGQNMNLTIEEKRKRTYYWVSLNIYYLLCISSVWDAWQYPAAPAAFVGNGITCWKHRYYLGPTWTLLHLWGWNPGERLMCSPGVSLFCERLRTTALGETK